MATSGSYDFSVTRDDVIKASLRLIGVIASGETPTADEIKDSSQALNIMLKSWQASNIGLWLNKYAKLYLEYGSGEYLLGPTGDHYALETEEETLAVAGASGDATVEVDSASGITNGDYIGIELDDNSTHWTTVNGVPVGNVVTLTDVLGDDAAEGNLVHAYTTKGQRPLDVIDANLRDVNWVDTPLRIASWQEFTSLSTKVTFGKPSMFHYHPTLTNGTLNVWPIPDDTTDTIMISVKYPLQDMDALDNDFDFPVEWMRALKYNLGVEVAPEFGIEPSATVQRIAMTSLYEASGWDREHGSVFFGRDRRR